jgi:hypothetical protein
MEGKEYLEAIKEGQRRFNEAATPLVKELCEHYDTERKVKLVIEVSNLSVIGKMIEFLTENTDECYTEDIPYPPSEGYSEFLASLVSAYKAGAESND